MHANRIHHVIIIIQIPSAVPYVPYQVNLTVTLCQVTILLDSLTIYTQERGEASAIKSCLLNSEFQHVIYLN